VSFAFAKAKRFSSVTVSTVNAATNKATTRASMGMASGNSLGHPRQSPRSIKPLNMHSGSMKVLNEDVIGDEDIDYDEEGMPLTAVDR